MQKIIYLFLCCLISITSFGQNNNTSSSATKGTEHYHQKNYSKALSEFNQLLENGNGTADLYYNIGNAQAQLKNIPEAIWAYEKSLKINPHLSDAHSNLKQLNKLIDNEIVHIKKFFLLSWWDSIIKILSPNIWAIFSFITLILWIGLLLMKWLKSKEFNNRHIAFLLGLWIILTCIAWGSYHNYKYDLNAIIIQTDSTMHIGADERSEAITPLVPGLKIKILDKLTNWYKVQLPDLSEGWVLMNDVKEI